MGEHAIRFADDFDFATIEARHDAHAKYVSREADSHVHVKEHEQRLGRADATCSNERSKGSTMTSGILDAVSFHSSIAAEFDGSYADDPNRLERLSVWQDVLSRHAGRVPLAYDIGCGSGRLTPLVAGCADQVVAIDGSAEMLDLARAYAGSRDVANVAFRQARLPIADTGGLAPAGLVIASSVIEYLPSLEDAVSFLARLAAPGGLVIFSVSNRDSLTRKLVSFTTRVFGRPRYFRFILHLIDPAGAKRLASQAGLEMVEFIYFDGQNPLNRMLSRFASPKRTSNMLLVVATKTAAA